MLLQILGMFKGGAATQILRSCTRYHLIRPERSDYQAAVADAWRANSENCLVALFDQIDRAVAPVQINIDLGVARHEFTDEIHHAQRPELPN